MSVPHKGGVLGITNFRLSCWGVFRLLCQIRFRLCWTYCKTLLL